MNKYIKIALGAVAITALVVGGVKTVKKAKENDANQPLAKVYPIVVRTMEATESQVKLTLPFLAIVANDKDVKLSARIAARILQITPSGTKVKKGEVLVRLDTISIKSSLQSVKKQINAAKIALKNTQATHKRTLELLKVQGASIEESQKELTLIASADANLNALQQKKIELQNSLSYSTIISPVDGVVAQTFVNKGAVSTPGHSLLAISSKNGFYVVVKVPTNLSVRGVILDGKEYNAMPLRSTDHGLAIYKVYTNDENLISGDRVEVNVLVYNQKGVKLPFDAILNRDGKSYVLVVDGKVAQAKEIHILQSAEQGLVIAESFEGKKIVVAKPDILLKLLSGYALSIKE